MAKFDYFLIKKALFSRLLLIPMFIKLSKTRVATKQKAYTEVTIDRYKKQEYIYLYEYISIIKKRSCLIYKVCLI